MRITEATIAQLAEAAYLRRSFAGGTILADVDDLKYYDEDDCQSYAGRIDNVAFVVFRGTESAADAVADMQFRRVPFVLSGSFEFTGVGTVHRGVLRYLGLIVADIIRDLQRMATNRVIVTGHSLGGGLAQLMAAVLGSLGYDVTLVTFGAMRAGDAKFCDTLQSVCPSIVRVVNYVDAVPRMPPALFGYRHTEGLAFFSRKQKLFRQLPWTIRVLDVAYGLASTVLTGGMIRWALPVRLHGMRQYTKVCARHVMQREMDGLSGLVEIVSE